MSKRVIFISLLLILIGLWSIWDMIAAFMKGSIVIDDTSALGSTCRHMMRRSRTPSARAALT